MSDTIKCACDACGAKYRLPVESQGRMARCKKCGAKFKVPQPKDRSLEDSVLEWLSDEPEDMSDSAPPRVINAPVANPRAEDDSAEHTDESAAPARVKK
ncbi:MAG: hypothetical protein KDA32_03540 [Phycisphaerales bacterium]|nr:hypothetical protein [Phycisphaerales bacterium]